MNSSSWLTSFNIFVQNFEHWVSQGKMPFSTFNLTFVQMIFLELSNYLYNFQGPTICILDTLIIIGIVRK